MKNIFKKILYTYLFVLVILNAMIPNRENVSRLSNLNTILPGIDKIYSTKNNIENSKSNSYSFKTFEILKKFVIH